MTNQADVCLTFDAACDAALEMENNIYRNYLEALRTVKDQAALAILRDAALVKLEHKHKLEKAALQGRFDEVPVDGPVPTMNLKIRCCDLHRIGPEADNRKALAYAVQMAEDALEFYRNMSEHCSGAPMAELFKSLGDDQTKHLQQLEDDYEEHFLTEG